MLHFVGRFRYVAGRPNTTCIKCNKVRHNQRVFSVGVFVRPHPNLLSESTTRAFKNLLETTPVSTCCLIQGKCPFDPYESCHIMPFSFQGSWQVPLHSDWPSGLWRGGIGRVKAISFGVWWPRNCANLEFDTRHTHWISTCMWQTTRSFIAAHVQWISVTMDLQS